MLTILNNFDNVDLFFWKLCKKPLRFGSLMHIRILIKFGRNITSRVFPGMQLLGIYGQPLGVNYEMGTAFLFCC